MTHPTIGSGISVLHRSEWTEKRRPYVDLCKGMGIILILLGHILKGGPTRGWIYSFHIPLFFFLSGYVVSPANAAAIRTFISRRLRSIVIPYFCFAAIFYIYWALLERRFRPDGAAIPRIQPLIGIVYGIGGDRWLTFDSPLWFLPCLFSTLLALVVALKYVHSRWGFGVLLLVCSIAAQLISRYCGHFLLPWSMNIVPASLVFCGCGHLVRSTGVFSGWNKSRYSFASYVALLASILLAHVNTPVDVAYLRYGGYLLFYPSALSGIAFVYFGCRVIEGNRAIEIVGRNSLGIMCVHYPIVHVLLGIMSIVYRQRADTFRNSLHGTPLLLAVSLALSLGACMYIERFAPMLLGRSTERVAEWWGRRATKHAYHPWWACGRFLSQQTRKKIGTT